MKKTYIGYSVLAAVLALSAQQANAQQGFGTDKPSKASVVEMTSGSKGLLIPRVALTSLDSFAPVSGEAPTDVDKTDALLVYNTVTAGTAPNDVTPGYYYWTTDGTSGKWNRIATGADAKTEPWFDQATNTEATDNEQDIYQLGRVAIGRDEAVAGTRLDVAGSVNIGNGNTFFDLLDHNSLAVGNDNSVGSTGLAVGHNNTVLGLSSFAAGFDNEALGSGTIAMGAGSRATMTSAIAIGNGALAEGVQSTAFGFGTIASSTLETVMGVRNAITIPINSFWDDNDPLLQLGNGYLTVPRRNAITVLKSGDTGIGIAGTEAAAKPTERLDIGSGNVRVREINTVAGSAATDKIVVADADGVLKTITVASITPDAVDANNGLTKTASDIIQLGGDLNKDTKITLDENELEIDATDSDLIISGLDKTKVQATNASTGITDHLLAVDANNNVKALKAAMPKFFYMPSIIVPTSQEQLDAAGSGKLTGDDFDNTSREGTINLYNRYAQQFGGSTLIKSETAAPALPVLPSGELYYYVTWYDTNVFTSVSVDDEGVLTYEVDENADITVGSFMNIVFAVKEGL